jgi:CubicO group peptidase (beta-lactamase class C family)
LWWTHTEPVNGRILPIAGARGNGGQRIFICKALNLVVVFNAGNYDKFSIRNEAYRALVKYILPAIK